MDTSPDYRNLFKLAGWASVLLLVYSFATLIIVAVVGGPPTSVKECFQMLHEDLITGLLRLDLLTVFAMPLYFVLFLGLHFALRPKNQTASIIGVSLAFVGVTLFLAAPSVFSFQQLSNHYFNSDNDVERNIILAAGEALLSTDIWNGTGPRIGGLLVEAAAIIFSVMMLNGQAFGKLTAYIGIITHALDLSHLFVDFFNSSFSDTIMMIAGPLYLIWFPLIARALFKLSLIKQHVRLPS